MELINCRVNDELLNNEDLIKLLGRDYKLTQFYNRNYNCTYDVFLIQSTEKKLVLKKAKNQYEVNAYKIFEEVPNHSTPKVYFMNKYESDDYIAMEYIENDLSEPNKIHFEMLVTSLADIHSKYHDIGQAKELKQWSKRTQLDSLEDDEITKEYIEIFKQAQNILSEAKKTLIHGDMIPLNSVITDEVVKIIDWEHCMYGPYILDLGRLLGDYNKVVRWVNPDWEESLLTTYYYSLNEKLKTSENQFLIHYQCAKLENYLGIVFSFKMRKWERTEWYDLNLKELLKAADVLSGLINGA